LEVAGVPSKWSQNSTFIVSSLSLAALLEKVFWAKCAWRYNTHEARVSSSKRMLTSCGLTTFGRLTSGQVSSKQLDAFAVSGA